METLKIYKLGHDESFNETFTNVSLQELIENCGDDVEIEHGFSYDFPAGLYFIAYSKRDAKKVYMQFCEDQEETERLIRKEMGPDW